MKDFKGKTAFVTGGASGIGLSMARQFGRAGMNVVVADIDEKAAKAAVERLTSEQIKAVPVVVDVTDRGSVREGALEAIAAFGKVHVVCNNAGVAAGGGIDTISVDDWRWVIDVNLMGVVHGIRSFLPHIRRHGEGGHIVNTASMAGMNAGLGLSPYAATKFAVVGISEGLAIQLQPLGIGVSVLCPSYVRTRIGESGRNRPAHYGPPRQFDPGSVGAAIVAEIGRRIEAGLDPADVAARVVAAIRKRQFYIFTHPGMRAEVEGRFDAILAAIDAVSAETGPRQ